MDANVGWGMLGGWAPLVWTDINLFCFFWGPVWHACVDGPALRAHRSVVSSRRQEACPQVCAGSHAQAKVCLDCLRMNDGASSRSSSNGLMESSFSSSSSPPPEQRPQEPMATRTSARHRSLDSPRWGATASVPPRPLPGVQTRGQSRKGPHALPMATWNKKAEEPRSSSWTVTSTRTTLPVEAYVSLVRYDNPYVLRTPSKEECDRICEQKRPTLNCFFCLEKLRKVAQYPFGEPPLAM
jgi:hypothetical protein